MEPGCLIYIGKGSHIGSLTVAGIAAFLFPEPIVSVFVGADKANAAKVVDIWSEFIRYVALTFGFMGIMRAYTGRFRGAGKTITAAAISVMILGVIRFPVAWITAGLLGETGVWLSFAVSNIAGAVSPICGTSAARGVGAT